VAGRTLFEIKIHRFEYSLAFDGNRLPLEALIFPVLLGFLFCRSKFIAGEFSDFRLRSPGYRARSNKLSAQERCMKKGKSRLLQAVRAVRDEIYASVRLQLSDENLTYQQIADSNGISLATVQRVAERSGISRQVGPRPPAP
jgi:hypothetical protein